MVLTDKELSLRNAVSISKAGMEAINQDNNQDSIDFDLSALTVVDSAAVAVMLAWQRHAQSLNRSLQFTGVSSSLISLVDLYGLHDFFIIREVECA
jgi:phospholipid transport system transporter-binding protein